MTHIATLYRPGNFSVVAHAAELAVNNGLHCDVVSSNTHFESNLGMTHFAAKAYSMEPM
jgi:hypothetical protein